MSKHYAVIMAGGRGERFWPQSRLKRPKHLLPIVGDRPMLSQTVERLEGLVPMENILVITNREQHDAVVSVCSMLPEENIVSEPVGRDTAAAVALAMVAVKHRDPEGVLAMLPADHVIRDREGFQSVLSAAFEAAQNDPVLATIGIVPTEPATGYGYIHRGEVYRTVGEKSVYRVREFVEKPDLETAKQYVASGEYYWNAGMFVWTVSAIGNALREFTPGLHRAFADVESGLKEGRPLDALLEKVFPELEKISIDYAVMEKAGNVVTLESDFDWDDVGSWPAIARHCDADENGNALRGAVVVENGANNIAVAGEGHLVALYGVDDLVVVHTGDATLVCRKDNAQDIKKLVKKLSEDPAQEGLI